MSKRRLNVSVKTIKKPSVLRNQRLLGEVCSKAARRGGKWQITCLTNAWVHVGDTLPHDKWHYQNGYSALQVWTVLIFWLSNDIWLMFVTFWNWRSSGACVVHRPTNYWDSYKTSNREAPITVFEKNNLQKKIFFGHFSKNFWLFYKFFKFF